MAWRTIAAGWRLALLCDCGAAIGGHILAIVAAIEHGTYTVRGPLAGHFALGDMGVRPERVDVGWKAGFANRHRLVAAYPMGTQIVGAIGIKPTQSNRAWLGNGLGYRRHGMGILE